MALLRRRFLFGKSESDKTEAEKYSNNYFKATYYATSNTSATKLFTTTYFTPTTMIDKMYVDGVEVTAAATYTFATTGDHEVICHMNEANFNTMRNMFSSSNLKTIDLSNLKTTKVTVAQQCFANCTYLASITTAEAKELLLSACTSGMGQFCYNSSNLEYADLSGITCANMNNISAIFHYCTNLKTAIMPSVPVASTPNYYNGIFARCTNIEEVDLGGFINSQWKTMDGVFGYCSSLKKVTMTGDVSNVTSFPNAFLNCNSLEFYYNSEYDYSNVIAQLPEGSTAIAL